MSKPERLRMQWRDSKRRCRSLYLNNYLYDKLEFLPEEQRIRQVERSRISNAAVRQNRTENEWAEVRKKHQIYKKNQISEGIEISALLAFNQTKTIPAKGIS